MDKSKIITFLKEQAEGLQNRTTLDDRFGNFVKLRDRIYRYLDFAGKELNDYEPRNEFSSLSRIVEDSGDSIKTRDEEYSACMDLISDVIRRLENTTSLKAPIIPHELISKVNDTNNVALCKKLQVFCQEVNNSWTNEHLCGMGLRSIIHFILAWKIKKEGGSLNEQEGFENRVTVAEKLFQDDIIKKELKNYNILLRKIANNVTHNTEYLFDSGDVTQMVSVARILLKEVTK